MCGGDGNIPAAISCKGCVCTLAICNIFMAVLGLAFTEVSSNAWMSLCMGSIYGGGVVGGFGLLGATELPAMTMLHALKKEGHLEVGGFLAEFADMEAMRPPFVAPSKRPGPSVGSTGKPKFMSRLESQSEPACDSVSSCGQCLARADCSFKKSGCVATADTSSNGNVTVCPPPCSSFNVCHECRDGEGKRDSTCYWVQPANSQPHFSGSFCSEVSPENSDNNYENTTHTTNSSCQSPEAIQRNMEICQRVADIYNVGRVGYVSLAIGCTLQLLGVCSWCGVKKDARANIPLLCTGCNIHWIAGLVVLIWGCFWMFATPLFFMFFSFIALYFLPCILGVPAGLVALVNICASKTAAGKVPEGYDGTEAQAARSQYDEPEPEYAAGVEMTRSPAASQYSGPHHTAAVNRDPLAAARNDRKDAAVTLAAGAFLKPIATDKADSDRLKAETAQPAQQEGLVSSHGGLPSYGDAVLPAPDDDAPPSYDEAVMDENSRVGSM